MNTSTQSNVKSIVSNILSNNTTENHTMTTQIQSLIEQGKDRAAQPHNIARSWLSTNLSLLRTIPTVTATWEEFVMSTIFGAVAEREMSVSGIVRLITAHIETLDAEDEKLMLDSKNIMSNLVDNGIFNKKREVRKTQIDGKDVEYKVYTFTAEMNFSLEMYEASLRDNAQMVCKPLHDAPTDWVVNGDEVLQGPGNLKMVNGQSIVSREVARAVNKVQAVPFRYNEDIMELVDDMITNPDYYGIEDDLETQRVLQAIDAIESMDKFFFPVTMDFRGRMYYRGGLLTPQGEKIVKALIEFHNGVQLGMHGLKWLKIHTANVLGADKLSIVERLAHIDSNIDDIMAVTDYDSFKELFPGADAFTGYTAILDLQRALEAPVIEEYVSHLVLHIDGTNNGLQHASVLTKDMGTAAAVNITASTDEDIVRDLYDDIVNWALEAGGFSHEATQLMLTYGRDLGKPVVMLKGYGAGDDTTKEGIDKVYKKKGITVKAGVAKEVGDALIKALNSNAGAVNKLVKALKRIAKKAELSSIRFRSKDGFVVVQEYLDFSELERKVGELSVRLKGAGTEDFVKAQTALAPNFVHTMDSTHMRMLADVSDAELALVHDSVGAHAGNMECVSQQVRETFVELHSYDQMATLCEWTGQRAPSFRGEYDVNEALNSAYIFS